MVDYVLEGPKWGASSPGTAGGSVTWASDASVPAGFVPVLAAAFADWSRYANIQFQQVASTAAAAIDFSLGAIDGPDRTLGYTSYSYAGSSMKSAAVVFDAGEGWHVAGSRIVSADGADFFVTALHEIGHAIGLGHYDATPAVMNAIENAGVTDLAHSDIDGVSALYGAAAPPTPTPTPTPTQPAVDPRSLFGTVAHDAGSHLGEVYALYEGLLGRAPDAGGARGWVDALDHGAGLQGVTQGILGSAEAQSHLGAAGNADFVEQLYKGVLGRGSDAGGKAGWVGALDHGGSRADVADSFVFSAEHLGQLSGAYQAGVFLADPTDAGVARLYYGILGRAPDAGGLQGWEGAAHAGTSLTAIAQSFLGSAEYGAGHGSPTDTAFVEGLYHDALGRPADAGGEQIWLSALSHGSTRADVAVGIAESPEAQAHLSGQIEQGWHLA